MPTATRSGVQKYKLNISKMNVLCRRENRGFAT
jgi:hypothetical protein